ncbi:MAG: Stp1/IreP family PP2C-type Ser/Thr phosphatase [Syntrophomonadaceae bacterium]|jgi:serine/threonine protein phosphatase PrpC
MDVVGISNIGLIRKKNEDHYLIRKDKGLFAVCDGMGGHKGGEVASRLAVEVIERNLADTSSDDVVLALNLAIKVANRLIWQKGRENPDWHNMGTTITAAVIKDNRLIISHIGDSCLFLIRDGLINKLTKDHTLAEQMMKVGLLGANETYSSTYDHILTRALGVDEEVEIDNIETDINHGDIILICSDGLTDMLDREEILEIIQKYKDDLNGMAKGLLDQALVRGGHDNITVILVRI